MSISARSFLSRQMIWNLGWTILFALFGAVYELFSHEVYSYYMIYAFGIPLILGVLPCALKLYSLSHAAAVFGKLSGNSFGTSSGDCTGTSSGNCTGTSSGDCTETSSGNCIKTSSGKYPRQRRVVRRQGCGLWNAGILTLTVGCAFHGVLEIYGTTNRLELVYLIVGGILLLAGLIIHNIRS